MNPDLLAAVVEQNPLAILITNLSGNIVYVNRRFSALTGYSSEEISGKNPRVLSSGKTDPQIYRKLWAAVLAGEIWQGELLNKRKNGQFFWESISITPVKDGEGRVTHFVGVWNDSTERKQNEERTAESLKEFERQ
ncbi:MAG TPA: PAS domain S-box protein, partial [bacterium]|nr:PAS domain S-box protein [bacterium]